MEVKKLLKKAEKPLPDGRGSETLTAAIPSRDQRERFSKIG
jgi:hypothetical protein